jgi:hypothetical protein
MDHSTSMSTHLEHHQNLLKYLTQTFMSHGHDMIVQPVTLSGDAEWPQVADAMIEASDVGCIMRADCPRHEKGYATRTRCGTTSDSAILFRGE